MTDHRYTDEALRVVERLAEKAYLDGHMEGFRKGYEFRLNEEKADD